MPIVLIVLAILTILIIPKIPKILIIPIIPIILINNLSRFRAYPKSGFVYGLRRRALTKRAAYCFFT
jgi:hypothetical protein